LHVRRELQNEIEPLVVSWGWHPEKITGTRFVQEQEWQGTRDIAAYLATPRAIQFSQENDWEIVGAECHARAQYAQEKISALTGLAPLSAETWFAQMVTLPLPPCDAQNLKTRLCDEYRIEVPIFTWNEKQFVRVSLQAYNTRADVDALADALQKILYA
jgi:isopenicillin-N epimerase